MQSVRLNRMKYLSNSIYPLSVKSYCYKPPRTDRFSMVQDSDLQHFESLLGTPGVFTCDNMLEAHNVDWTKKFVGQSKLVLKPAN